MNREDAAPLRVEYIYGFALTRPSVTVRLSEAIDKHVKGHVHLVDVMEAAKREALRCKYCGRTKQTQSHKQCDGCGAPKEVSHG